MTAALHSLRYRGLGASTAQQTVSMAGAAASTTVSALGTAGVIAGAAVPIIGAAIAGVTLAIEALLNTGCGQTCIETSQWANQAEALLQQNIAAYFGTPAPRDPSVQQQAMSNFQKIWNQLVQLCSQPGLGQAGKNCISDRQDGACHYKAKSPQYPGEPAAGQCWNWWNAYYYPIANDTQVGSALSSVTAAVSSLFGGIDPTVLLIGAGVLVLVMVIS